MKQITYAGESVMTSDEIGSVLVELTAALARKGLAEAVTIPICDDTGGDHRTAELVIGQGNDVLAVPVDASTTVPGFSEPDFAVEADELRAHLQTLPARIRTTAVVLPPTEPDLAVSGFEYDLDLANTEDLGSDSGSGKGKDEATDAR